MLLTAHSLASDPRLCSKTIVLTGAYKPERFLDSDASFNVGLAVSAVQLLHRLRPNQPRDSVPAAGVYLAMNGTVYPHNECDQDSLGFYVEKSQK